MYGHSWGCTISQKRAGSVYLKCANNNGFNASYCPHKISILDGRSVIFSNLLLKNIAYNVLDY